jgi:hypothetical protein
MNKSDRSLLQKELGEENLKSGDLKKEKHFMIFPQVMSWSG